MAKPALNIHVSRLLHTVSSIAYLCKDAQSSVIQHKLDRMKVIYVGFRKNSLAVVKQATGLITMEKGFTGLRFQPFS